MKPVFFRSLCLGAFLGWLVVGCVRSEQPLGAAQDAKPDPRLVGTWHDQEKADADSDFRVSFDAGGRGHIIGKGDDGSGKIVAQDTAFFITRTAQATYVNALLPDDGTKPTGSMHYQFFRYTVSGDGKTLDVRGTRADAFEKAVKASKLKGTIESDPQGGIQEHNVVLQDSSATILHFIEGSPPDEVFGKLGVYKKVN